MLAFMVSVTAHSQPSPANQVQVLAVVDGDTFSFDPKATGVLSTLSWKVRVLGIDTPERGSHARCAYEKQRAELAALMTRRLLTASGNVVTLSAAQHDKYGGRIDARVTLRDGSDLGQKLIDAGLARAYTGGKKIPWCP
jgi:endonuclease YncB( thermonuclease family)